jgi:hypothetical protein
MRGVSYRKRRELVAVYVSFENKIRHNLSLRSLSLCTSILFPFEIKLLEE